MRPEHGMSRNINPQTPHIPGTFRTRFFGFSTQLDSSTQHTYIHVLLLRITSVHSFLPSAKLLQGTSIDRYGKVLRWDHQAGDDVSGGDQPEILAVRH